MTYATGLIEDFHRRPKARLPNRLWTFESNVAKYHNSEFANITTLTSAYLIESNNFNNESRILDFMRKEIAGLLVLQSGRPFNLNVGQFIYST